MGGEDKEPNAGDSDEDELEKKEEGEDLDEGNDEKSDAPTD